MKSQRKFKNFLLVPESQIRFGILFLAVSSAMHIVVTIMALSLYTSSTTGDPEASPFPAWLLLLIVLVIYAVLQAFAFILALVMSHRLFGPLVPLNRLVNELKAGNYKARVNLREKDEPKMREFAESLNELAAKLEMNAGR